MIDFIIIKNQIKVPNIYSTLNKDDKGVTYRPCVSSLERQAKELDIDINIKIVDINEVPTSTKSILIGFLCENNLIPDDYLGRILSMNNLYRSANGFIGDYKCICNNNYIHNNSIDLELINIYHGRNIGSVWNKNSLMELTDEIKYPLIYGAIFNSYYYNSNSGFVPILTPRTISPMSQTLINKKDQLVWSKRLNILEFLPSTEIKDMTFGNWFYEMGYVSKERHEENPNILLLKSKFNKEEEYKNRIHFLCWMYDAGCYESHIGHKIG